MKAISKNILLLLILSITSYAHGFFGHKTGNGGHTIASHFSTIAENISLVWSDICLNQQDEDAFCKYRQDFQDTLNKDSFKYIKIKAEEKSNKVHSCQIDNTIREACNNGRDTIIVNSSSWSKINTPTRKINLVLHEIFSVLELDSSDHYKNSIAFSSMLKRKQYDFNQIASFELMPKPCSIKISEKESNNSIESLILQNLRDKNYSTKSKREFTRYELKIRTQCETPGYFDLSCGVYSELEDNYTGEIIFNNLKVFTDKKNRVEKIFSEMKEEINHKINECKS